MYITRYTEESFSTLISLIFITDGFKKLFHIADSAPLNFGWRENSATHYGCSCHLPQFSGTVEKWTIGLTQSDWLKNASDRIIMHGKEPDPERLWKNDHQYHCIYLNDYQAGLIDIKFFGFLFRLFVHYTTLFNFHGDNFRFVSELFIL